MRKFMAFAAVLLLFVSQAHETQAERQNPDYEKYGRMAVAIISSDYPGDPIREYEYIGRKNVNESDVADTFRFEVEEKGKTFFVRVIVQHNLTAEKAVTLRVVPEKR
ncbi:hypothetical protein A8F94_17085 [Bacillus sp. FJAT-27225]|uniref:DUF3889 domain-containing protein n=1 Tax=Bacillus sp. FJAT-27225 TaxID=1743144 RepID=UPI00080C242C|nr:DUF3889 domain-containing protein [Bacillus sp. FJAT-27225]OCA84415.1 hypothetical protein A8F94_17085 [Bacillus sp. FJAT-27225]